MTQKKKKRREEEEERSTCALFSITTTATSNNDKLRWLHIEVSKEYNNMSQEEEEEEEEDVCNKIWHSRKILLFALISMLMLEKISTRNEFSLDRLTDDSL